MGLFGAIAGLFTASKVHDKIDQDHDDSFIEDSFEVGVSNVAGSIVGDLVDDLFDDSDDDDDDDDDF